MRNDLNSVKSFFHNLRKPIKRFAILIGFLAMLTVLLSLSLNVNVVAVTAERIYASSGDSLAASDYDCILILGAGVRRDGTPTPMLNDRLITGMRAYKACAEMPVVLLSGDSEEPDYTETSVMKRVIIEMGVTDDKIICDGFGLSTYESIWRAKNVYGFNKILIVSQKYHLYRAIYIADSMGLEAYGVDAALQGYVKQPVYDAREYLARVKDALYSAVQPTPKYTYAWEDMYE